MSLFTEVVMVILGLLLAILALGRRFLLPPSLGLWLGLGVILILWGGWAWMRRGRYARPASRVMEGVRGASLVLAGAAMLAMTWLPMDRSRLMLVVVGAILALRGLTGVALAAGTMAR